MGNLENLLLLRSTTLRDATSRSCSRQRAKICHHLCMEEILREFAAREDQAGLIFPDEELERQIEKEIAARSRANATMLPTVLGGGRVQELDRRSISAGKRTFVQEAMIVIDQIAAELRQVGAREFELAFKNVMGNANPKSERIIIGVRYTT